MLCLGHGVGEAQKRRFREAGEVAAQGSTSRQRRPVISGEFRKFADLGRFNLWRPMVVARTGGSKCVQAQPAGRQGDQGSLRCLFYARVAWPPRQQAEPGTARPTGSKWNRALPGLYPSKRGPVGAV